MQGKKAVSTAAIAAVLAAAAPNHGMASGGPGVAPSVEDNGSVARIRIKAPRGTRMGVQEWPDRCAVSVTANRPVDWSLARVRKRLGVSSVVGDSLVDSDGFVAAIPCGASVRTTYSNGHYVVTVRPRAGAKGRKAKESLPAAGSERDLEANVKEAVKTAVQALDKEETESKRKGSEERPRKAVPAPAPSKDSPPDARAETPSVAKVLTEDKAAKAPQAQPAPASPPAAAASAVPAASVKVPAPLGKSDVREGTPIDKDEVSLAKARALLADGRPEEAREAVRRVKASPLLPDDAAEADAIEQAAQLMTGQPDRADAVRSAAAADKGWLPFEVLRLSLSGDMAGAGGIAPAAVAAARNLPTEAAWRVLPYIAEAAYRNGDRMTVSEASRQLTSLRTNTGSESVLNYVKGLNEAGLGRHAEALAAFQDAGRGTGPWRDKAKILAVAELGRSGKGDAREQEARYEELLSTTRGTPAETDVLTALAGLRKAGGNPFGALAAHERLAEVAKGTISEAEAGRALQEAVDASYAAAVADPRLAGKLLKVHETYGSQGAEDVRKRRSDQFAGIIAALGLAPAAAKAPDPARAPEPVKAPEATKAPEPARPPVGPKAEAPSAQEEPMVSAAAEETSTEETREIPPQGTGLAAVRERPQPKANPAKEPKPAQEAPKAPQASVERARELWAARDMAGAAREYKALADGGVQLDPADASRWAAAALSSGDEETARAAAEIAGGEIRDAILSMGSSPAPAPTQRQSQNPLESARSALDSASALLDAHKKQFPATEGE